MNKELFCSMQEQLRPSTEARDALMEKLASTKKKTAPVRRYAAIAACAAVIAAAIPVYGMASGHLNWQSILARFSASSDCYVEILQPHSYVMAGEAACWPEDSLATGNTVDTGGGDQDQGMTSGELTDNMLEAGFTQEDADGYLASGWQMTWAKWWKFCHQAEESGDWTLEALLDFSRAEKLAVNTRDLPAEMPGGAYIGGAPDQSEAIMAYQNLMARFEKDCGPDRYPEWYGGAYIDEHAGLIVNIAAVYEPEAKDLYFQIWKWAGSEQVGFGCSGTGLSLNQLKELQKKVIAAMEELGLQFGCGIDEENGQVELTLYHYSEEALWALARLDPADTAIRVTVGQFTATDSPGKEPPAPGVSQSVQPGGAPAPGAVENAAAGEPQG